MLNNQGLERARILAPDHAVVMVERYGVPPGHDPDDVTADCPREYRANHTVSGSAEDIRRVIAEELPFARRVPVFAEKDLTDEEMGLILSLFPEPEVGPE